MKCKVVISPPISQVIRGFGLPREVLLQLLMELHEVLPTNLHLHRHRRMKDARRFFYRIAVPQKDAKEHLFVVAVDDTTSPDYLLITDLGHAVR